MNNCVRSTWIRNATTAIVSAAILAGCLSEDDSTTSFNGAGEPAAPANTAPRISGTPPGSVNAGEMYSFTPSASDDDGDALTFSISNQPSWASFDSSTGRLSGMPTIGDAGTDGNIVISVSDGLSSASLAAFSITVNAAAANSPPRISGTPPSSVNVGATYSFSPGASDPDNDALTFSISNQPSWASFDASTGRLSGTPGDADVGTVSNLSLIHI
mgnify:FL=1